jgi:ferredoxin
MKIVVDRNLCQDHGQCAIAAPEVFRMDENGKLVYNPNPDGSLREYAEEAADVCPAQAILLEA